MSYDAIPEYLRSLQKFVARSGKQPFVKNKKHTHLTAFEWNKHPENFLTFEEALEFVAKNEKVITGKDKTISNINGIGMVMYRAVNQELPLLIGGDLDCCRDPITGEITKWASQFLLGMLPFYTEASPSKCGIRFFVMGNIDRNHLTGIGPQGEISDELKERTFAVKPGAFAKHEKGDPAFNSFELYEHDKHLSLTGDKIEEYCFPKEDRTIPILRFLSKYLTETKIQESIVEYNPLQPASLPSLNILDVINTEGFRNTGTQLEGSHPLGSTTGKNLLVNPSKNVYCYMHNDCRAGGNAWDWLACECGAVPWEKSGKGRLRDRKIVKKVLQHAVSRGLISDKDADIDLQTGIMKVDLNSPIGSFGLLESNGTIVRIMPNKMAASKRTAVWMSDCAVWIDTETQCDGITDFLFRGKGAKDGRDVEFTLTSNEVRGVEFQNALTAAFGHINEIEELEWKHVQRMSRNVKIYKKVKTPEWYEDTPMIPGYDIGKEIIFELSSHIPAKVYDGDLELAKDVIRKLFALHPCACILVTTVLGAPAVDRWHPQDRFAIGLWGTSGNMKTTSASNAMAMWGLEYLTGPQLMAGRAASTASGALDIFKAAGFLPQIYDDVKTVDKIDKAQYIALIHKIMGGYDKVRSMKDGGLREPIKFHCTPIITGEIKPMEASTSARVLSLDWNLDMAGKKYIADATDQLKLIQHALPTVGYHWIKFLHETKEVLGAEFDRYRQFMSDQFIERGYVNSGRLATNYAMLKSIWSLLEISPLGDVFLEYRPQFIATLDKVIADQGDEVCRETEVSRFLRSLKTMITVEPRLLINNSDKIIYSNITPIGRWMKNGIFVLPELTLAAITKTGAFEQIPDVNSMTKSLVEIDALIQDTDGKHKMYKALLNGNNIRGWYIRSTKIKGIDQTKMNQSSADLEDPPKNPT